MLTIHTLTALNFKIMVSMFDFHVPLLESFALAMGGNLLNFLPLNTALAFRSLYLKKVYGVKFVEFGLGTVIILLTGSIAAGILGIAGFCYLSFTAENPSLGLLLLFILFFLGPFGVLGLAWIYSNRRGERDLIHGEGHTWFARLYSSLIDSINLVATKPKILFKLFAVSMASGVLFGVKFWLISESLGYPANFFSGLVLQSTYRVLSFITIMPAGAIGLKEAVIGFGTKGLGGDVMSGVMISAVHRVINIAWIVLCGSTSLVFLGRRLAQKSSAYSEDHSSIQS